MIAPLVTSLFKKQIKLSNMSSHESICNALPVQGYGSAGNRSRVFSFPENMQTEPAQLAILAHEIRNPLSTINLSVEMLKSIVIDDNQKMFLDMIARGSMRINEILTEIHTFFQANEIHVEEYSIHQLLDEVVAMAGDRLVLKHISVRKDYAAKDCKMILNRPQIKIALTNIIINAIDAMAYGKGNLELVTRSTDLTCDVHITDNGCGISRRNLKNIFKPYFTNKPDGLGLGLATTREILRSNHVTVKVRSTVGKGTSFILTFEK
jgi:signal transduction histidine kinase